MDGKILRKALFIHNLSRLFTIMQIIMSHLKPTKNALSERAELKNPHNFTAERSQNASEFYTNADYSFVELILHDFFEPS
jgi:hypothetical protein